MTERELKELAAVGIRAEITRLQGLLAQITDGATAKTVTTRAAKPHRTRRTMSKDAREKMRKSMKARWAAARAAGVTSLKAVKVKGERKKR
jgi:uncharacterized protein with von Willebrand factor type A (vWA) domain